MKLLIYHYNPETDAQLRMQEYVLNVQASLITTQNTQRLQA